MSLNLDELERLASAATPGPWVVYDGNSWRRIGTAPSRDRYDDAVLAPTVASDGHPDLYSGDGNTAANLTFIAASREAVPELITALRASQAENARLREALEVKGKADIYRDGFDAAVAVAESVKTHVSWGPAATPNDGLEEGMKAIRSSLQRARAAITAALAQGPET